MEPNDTVFALKEVIEAQQEVITSWESVFASVESTIINLLKNNLELKLRLIHQINPNATMPEGVFEQMKIIRARYKDGEISPLEYFVYIDSVLSVVE